MQLETDLFIAEIGSSAGIAEALAMLDTQTNARAILSSGEQNYVQAGGYSNGFVIERRSGSEETHMHARPVGRPPLPALLLPEKKWWQKLFSTRQDIGPHEHAFTREEVIVVFSAYFDGAEDPEFVAWHPGYS